MNLDDLGLWVTEYSQTQDRIHVDLLETSIDRNLIAAIEKKSSDWIPTRIGTYEECMEAGKRLLNVQEERPTKLYIRREP